MKPITLHILTLLFLLIFSAGHNHAQNTMKTPLPGDQHKIERNDFGKPFFLKLDQETTIDSLTLRFDYSAIKWNIPYTSEGAAREVLVCQIKLSENGEEYIISFDSDRRAEKGELTFEWKKYVVQIMSVWGTLDGDSIQLKVEKKPIEQNDFGKPFFLKLDQETTIGSLTVRYNMSIIGRAARSAKETFHDIGRAWIVLSENGEKETIVFDSDKLFAKKQLSFDWKNYRIWVLAYPGDSVQLKIEKK